jgi:transposase
LDKLYQATELPYKKSKNHKLDKEEKEYNAGLSRLRVKVENILAKIKVFRILSDRYRNKRKGYSLKINIVAGIINLKNGFVTA